MEKKTSEPTESFQARLTSVLDEISTCSLQEAEQKSKLFVLLYRLYKDASMAEIASSTTWMLKLAEYLGSAHYHNYIKSKSYRQNSITYCIIKPLLQVCEENVETFDRRAIEDIAKLFRAIMLQGIPHVQLIF